MAPLGRRRSIPLQPVHNCDVSRAANDSIHQHRNPHRRLRRSPREGASSSVGAGHGELFVAIPGAAAAANGDAGGGRWEDGSGVYRCSCGAVRGIVGSNRELGVYGFDVWGVVGATRFNAECGIVVVLFYRDV